MQSAIEKYMEAGPSISGPKIFYTIDTPIGPLHITETFVSMWVVMGILILLGVILSRSLNSRKPSTRQVVAEMVVSSLESMVRGIIGEKKTKVLLPYIGTVMAFSCVSSLMGLISLRPPTADLNVVACWALITFGMITYYSIKTNGVAQYFKSYLDPFPFLLPINILGVFATPVSLSLRHYSNLVAGTIISALLYYALAGATSAIPIIPVLQIGLPGVLSLYFDLFTAGIQAFVFTMLTLIQIKMASE